VGEKICGEAREGFHDAGVYNRATSMNRPGKINLRLLIGAAIALAVAAAAALAVRSLTQPVVQVTTLVRGPVVQAFYATGTIVPEREYPVRANVAGTLYLEEGIDKGVKVRRDQKLGRVVSEDLEQKLKQTEADLREKTARAEEATSPVLAEFDRRVEAFGEVVKLATAELKRLQSLSETGGASQLEIERAQDRIATARGEMEAYKALRATKLLELKKDLDVARSAYGIAKWSSEQQDLLAPVDGVILDWPTPNRTRLPVNENVLTVADVRPERLVMRAAVDEEDKNKLRVGQVVKMTLYSFPDDKFPGTVKTIYDKADPQRRTFEVDVQINGAGKAFAPGMTGELAFVEKERPEADILPRQALQGDYFYVVRDGRVQRIAAKAGVRNVTRVEVLEGVGPKDLVMLSPVGALTPGTRVRADFMDPRVAADMNRPAETEIFKGGF
jgi:RND family efflux transporter MFP subunit